MRATIALASALLAAAATYDFITFGDFGTGDSLQTENAAQINKHCATSGACNIVALLGDNIYDGPMTTTDPRWKSRIWDMYTMDAPLLTCFGNHDYEGSVKAYLAQKADPRWHLPATNYTYVIPEADLTIVYVDSNRACPSYMSAPYGDCDIHCMEQLADVGCTNKTATKCWADHVSWLNTTLAGVTTKWKFVAGHHPIDNENMPSMAAALAAHGVQAYLSGHVHNLQHAEGADGVQYFVSGAGGFASPADVNGTYAYGATHRPRSLSCPEGAACAPLLGKYEGDGPGFLSLSIDNDAVPAAVTAKFIKYDGSVVYTTTFS